MTGFIRGLFGGNKQPSAPKEGGAFFLDEDDAKTFGDIDYMRSNKVVKRTFARKKGQTEEIESVRQISAMQKQDINEYGVPTQSTPAPTPTFENSKSTTEPPKFQRRKGDDSMDMFRNMARDLKKK
ncbi:MAG: hypothetical protein F6J95_007410 [Leptolyngbya sp. SIO1E4]|nr:hypothetical protein [Leptolyngbya sp. SIO1E4]